MLFVEFVNNDQNKFLSEIKKKFNLSWDKLATKLNIKRSTLYYYLRQNKLPKFKYDYFCKIAKITRDKYNIKLIKIGNTCNEIKYPKLSQNLSEFLGILAGDGCLLNKPYSLVIVSHKVLDRYLMEIHLPNLINNLFGISPKIYYQDNTVRCIVFSKKLVTLLNEKYGFPIGKKKAKLFIPENIFKNKSLLKPYLRGVFDTDGSFYSRRKNEPVIEYISCDKFFINQLKWGLSYLGFNFGLSGKNLYLYNKGQINQFFSIIKPVNKKHNLKFDIFKKEGRVPKTTELLNLYSRELFNG